MRIAIALFFIISFYACSNSTDIIERPESSPDIKSAESTMGQEETDINKMNPDMIRKQTERTFRSIKSQNKGTLEPLTPASPGDSDAEKP